MLFIASERWWNGPRLELEIFTVLFLFVLCVCTTKRDTKESLTHSKRTNWKKKKQQKHSDEGENEMQ